MASKVQLNLQLAADLREVLDAIAYLDSTSAASYAKRVIEAHLRDLTESDRVMTAVRLRAEHQAVNKGELSDLASRRVPADK